MRVVIVGERARSEFPTCGLPVKLRQVGDSRTAPPSFRTTSIRVLLDTGSQLDIMSSKTLAALRAAGADISTAALTRPVHALLADERSSITFTATATVHVPVRHQGDNHISVHVITFYVHPDAGADVITLVGYPTLIKLRLVNIDTRQLVHSDPQSVLSPPMASKREEPDVHAQQPAPRHGAVLVPDASGQDATGARAGQGEGSSHAGRALGASQDTDANAPRIKYVQQLSGSNVLTTILR